MGQSLPKWSVRTTSAFPPIATELRTSLEVGFVPKGDVGVFRPEDRARSRCSV
jgi:hypothetical protein